MPNIAFSMDRFMCRVQTQCDSHTYIQASVACDNVMNKLSRSLVTHTYLLIWAYQLKFHSPSCNPAILSPNSCEDKVCLPYCISRYSYTMYMYMLSRVLCILFHVSILCTLYCTGKILLDHIAERNVVDLHKLIKQLHKVFMGLVNRPTCHVSSFTWGFSHSHFPLSLSLSC